MAYTAFNSAKPVVTDTRQSTIDYIRTNGVALRDGVISGRVPGWTLSVSGGTAEEPAIRLWSNGTERIRGTYTYSSGYVTAVTWEYSSTSGSSYDAICSETASYDGSGNQTGGANSSLLSWLYEWIGKLKALRSLYTAHAAATGTSVHGLGSMATQAATSVSVSGGAINGTAIGTTTPAEGLFTRACEQFNTYTPSSGASQALDWAKGGSNLTNNGSNTVSFSNVPSSRLATHLLNCSVFNSTTFPAAVTWGLGGKPSIAGRALVSLATVDGGTTVYAGIYWREN